MDEEIKEVGEMATIEDEEQISIEEDYTTLEAETIIIDDDSNIQTDAKYEQAVVQKELADEAREALSAVLLSVLEKGEINDDDIAEIAAQQEIYTENVTALKILGLMAGDEKSTAGKSTTNIVTSNIDYNELIKVLSEKADWLYIDEDGQVMLNGEVVPKLKVVELEAEKIKADVGEFKNLTTENFTATNATIENLKTNKADIEYLNANYATIENLNATNANITNLQATKADITELNAAKGNINTLTSNLADITTLVNGNLTSDNIQSMVITGDKFTVANGFIKNAMIESINANKINTGTINTNNVKIQSADGSMVINGTTQQFKDKNNKVRIQIGKDAQGNFTFALFSQDGVGVLIDETGIKSGAVPNGLIVNDMVSNQANISGSKLDINSVISSINNGTTTIKGTRIQLDEQGQSLQVAFSQLKSKVETIENVTIDGDLSSVIEQVTSNTTSINTMQGQISSLISNTTITKANGEVVQLKDAYSSTKQTVDSMTSKIGSMETTIKSTLKSTVAEYYVSTSNTSQTGGSWSTTSPTWQSGKYIWQRMKYTYTDGSTNYSTPVCIQGAKGNTGATGPQGPKGDTGAKGDAGEKGQSLTKSTPQWYSSTSNTSQTGGSWVESMPTLEQGKYIWLRYKLTWANPTTTTYTTPTLEMVVEAVKTVSSKQTSLEQNLDGFKTTVSNTYATKTIVTDLSNNLKNNYSTTTAMNSAINQKANEITSTVSETYATKKSVSDVSNNLKNNYSTTSAMNSAINQKANEITSSVSSTYATKFSLKATDDKFANYSTTSQMNSAINQKANEITSTVSETYATKQEINAITDTIGDYVINISNEIILFTTDLDGNIT